MMIRVSRNPYSPVMDTCGAFERERRSSTEVRLMG